MKKYRSCLLGLLIYVSSCKEEPIPAYVNIPSFTVTTKTSEGSNSSNISDAWIYQNYNLQGVYELPVEFPIIAEGNTQLLVYAGIKLNGISTTRAAYPFYDPDTINLDAQAATVDTFYPSVRYSPFAEFDFIENFEIANGFSNMQRVTGADVFEGNYSGQLIADSTEVIAATNSAYVIPFNTKAVFLEMDYKNNHVFEVGIKSITGTQILTFYKLTVPSQNEWNKLYINFTPEVNGLQADSYQIYFRLAAQTEPDSIKIFFDNLKLIHTET